MTADLRIFAPSTIAIAAVIAFVLVAAASGTTPNSGILILPDPPHYVPTLS